MYIYVFHKTFILMKTTFLNIYVAYKLIEMFTLR